MKVLIRKLIGLGRDEDGAALVITLALLMFMYVTCAGVLAIGQSVKDRIHLQNACDAAAYSAAVVQADTLSRIATINKAMSWTYVCLCRREMDYITYRWLEHTCKHYELDKKYAVEGRVVIGSIPLSDDKRVLLRNQGESEDTVDSTVDRFLDEKLSHESFYAGKGKQIEVLENQIMQDKETILAMGKCIDGLISDLPGRVLDVGKSILGINLPSCESCRYMIVGKNDFFEQPSESRFLDYCGEPLYSDFSSDWYELAHDTAPGGIWRKYKTDKLRSDWYWSVIDPLTGKPRAAAVCPHAACSHCSDTVVLPSASYRHASLTAGALEKKYVPYYTGAHESETGARPRQLTEGFFGSAGTITVGLARYNENPWARVFGPKSEVARNGMDRLAGIFAAFNPYKHVEWSWAFSSAKAGYREKGGEYDGTRAYRVDWDSQDPSWNLCVSDWDAVFVPVRSACMEAKDGSWKLTSGNNDFLTKWIESGDWKAFDGFNPPQYDLARNGMPRLPRMHNARGTLHDISWTRLRDMLYH